MTSIAPQRVSAAPAEVRSRSVGLAVVLDEAADAFRSVSEIKAVLICAGTLVGMFVLPWQVCVAWAGVCLLLEVWGRFATRARGRGETPTRGERLSFVACCLAINVAWLCLGMLMCLSGTLQGQATGTIMILAVVMMLVLMFYSVPAVFLAAGAIPAIGALTVVMFAEGFNWLQLAPVWLGIGVSTVFSLGRALDTPSAQASKRALNESLSRYEVLADNVTDIIARTDLDGVHQYLSPACLAVTGYRPEELIGVSRLDLLHPDDHDLIGQCYVRMLADPERTEVVTVRVRHRDGHWIWLQSSARLVLENGAPVGVIDVSRDVTRDVANEAALREAKIEAEAANRAKAEFLANVSHEIRTPMNGVLGALHLLDRENISPEGRELIRQANDCGRMLSQLLNDVLDFSKIEAGQLDLAPEAVDAGEALRTVTALLAGEARAKGLTLTCEVSGEALWIEADPVRLRQAMFNLMGNAIKFTLKGHVTARLRVTEAGPGRRRLRFEVEDSGIGMSAAARQHLFERFRQAESNTARRFGGTGLGLSITQGLARIMGGAIDFTSVEGEGSTFWLEVDCPAAEASAAAAVEGGLLEGVSILLVEDNPTNRLVARTMLQRLGATVEEAEDGLLGLAAARDGAHDLILMDVQMPHMNGIEATRAIRGLPGPASETPIIGLTANVMAHQQAEYRAAGMNGVVAKPMSPGLLLAEIARLMASGEEPMAASA